MLEFTAFPKIGGGRRDLPCAQADTRPHLTLILGQERVAAIEVGRSLILPAVRSRRIQRRFSTEPAFGTNCSSYRRAIALVAGTLVVALLIASTTSSPLKSASSKGYRVA